MRDAHADLLSQRLAKANEARRIKRAKAVETAGAPPSASNPPPNGSNDLPNGGGAKPPKGKEGKEASAKTPTLIPTTTLAPSVLVRVVPKVFTTSSDIIWQAMAALQNEKGWPKMDPGDFIDTVLFYFCRLNYGIILGGYAVVEKSGGRKYTEDEVRTIAAKAAANVIQQMKESKRLSP